MLMYANVPTCNQSLLEISIQMTSLIMYMILLKRKKKQKTERAIESLKELLPFVLQRISNGIVLKGNGVNF